VGQTRVGVAVQSVAGDVLLTEVSTVGVPEPAPLMTKEPTARGSSETQIL